MITFESYGITESQIFEEKIKSEERINKLLNLDYNERKEIGDDETDLNDVNYGNNIVNSNVKRMNHGTGMAGVIAAVRSNSIGSKGISDKIKIMPIIISAFGDEHDKDMALAIRYAADNGAKVINISSGKYFSLRKEWVESAISYAEAKNVLIVNSAGNDNLELTLKGDLTYPNDSKLDGSAISNNFIKVGASSYDLSKLKGSSSNYGYAEVDMFAPGVDIYTLDSTTGGYKTISGTSSAAALTSGIAALIWSYYPSLNASEVKYILINSGIRYENIVSIETKDKKIISEKFQNLSKNGKILNAYFALKLAEKLN
jgi:subtilisin family serine protease